jgi:hypothetical protein
VAVGRDASGATVTSQPALVTVSNTVPDISNVRVAEVTPTSAVVRWSTTLTADSQVEYGPTQDYGFFSAYDGTLVTTHARPITGLSPATTYHYRARSTNWRGVVSVSSNQTFTTAAGVGGGGGPTEPPREQPRPPEQPGPLGLRLAVTVTAAPSRVGYTITATVRREESPVADAAVQFQLFGPSGQLLASLSRTTDDSGVASTVYLRSDWQMSGVHRVEVSADQEGRRGFGTTTFSLQ